MINLYNTVVNVTIRQPENIASYIQWLGPLIARLVVGEMFMMAGWIKLHNMDVMIENFTNWGIPFPNILTPFVSGAEFVCGILIMLGLLTRISGVISAIIMVVAVKSALWEQVDSLDTLLSFSESAYFAIFFWLAVAGPGKISLDHWLVRKQSI